MAWIRKTKGWELPEREATPEAVYVDRRRFLKMMGTTTLGAVGLAAGCGSDRTFTSLEVPGSAPDGGVPKVKIESLYPATRNPGYTLDRPLTDEGTAGSYNTFYEFTLGKSDVLKQAERFLTDPWKVRVTGLVRKPATFDADDLVRRLPLEERIYRHRCVEAWAMAVPWTGFPMKALLGLVEPLSAARYVKLTTFLDPLMAPGQFSNPGWPWPYVEALTMPEAANELTMLVTGIYGKQLTKQHGPPIRLVVPWKYGFKSIKSIVRIDFTAEQPATFWNTQAPEDFTFTANVLPQGPPPHGVQSTEWMIGTGEKRATLPYNGYGEYVAGLY